MEKLLFVDCCIRREESRTKVLADYFMDKIRAKGKYEIENLCLMDENLSFMSEGFFRQRDELLDKKELNHPRFHYAHQFAEADRIVIAAPFWDLSFPALLKIYIENLCVHGITFGYGPKGLQGICKAQNLVFITTRGTFYENSPMEMGSRYMEAMCRFWGIGEYDCVFAEGLDAREEPAELLMNKGKALADKVAEKF